MGRSSHTVQLVGQPWRRQTEHDVLTDMKQDRIVALLCGTLAMLGIIALLGRNVARMESMYATAVVSLIAYHIYRTRTIPGQAPASSYAWLVAYGFVSLLVALVAIARPTPGCVMPLLLTTIAQHAIFMRRMSHSHAYHTLLSTSATSGLWSELTHPSSDSFVAPTTDVNHDRL